MQRVKRNPSNWNQPDGLCLLEHASPARAGLREDAVQFHPEAMRTSDGAKLLRNFALKIAGFKGSWTMAVFKGSGRRQGSAPRSATAADGMTGKRSNLGAG